VTAFLTRVRNSLFTALLRSARLAFVMMRFFWLLMFATLSKASGEDVHPQLRLPCRTTTTALPNCRAVE